MPSGNSRPGVRTIHIPRASDPGDGFDVRAPGTAHVYVLETICTDGWALDSLEDNRDKVREVFLEAHSKLKPAEAKIV